MVTSHQSIFLRADWRYLAMLNYEIDPRVLEPLVPTGTELDSFGGKTYASMVGFLFLNTRVLGVPVPFHRNLEEVNLRFYVRRHVDGEYRRGVVFVRELVPRRAIAWIANVVYGENYAAVSMAHSIRRDAAQLGRVHHGALLGLRAPTRRRNRGVSCGASALARVDGDTGAIRLRRGAALWGGVFRGTIGGSGVSVFGRWIARHGVQGYAAQRIVVVHAHRQRGHDISVQCETICKRAHALISGRT